MKINEIQLVTEIENIHEDGVDVIVTLDGGFSYVIAVVTSQNLLSLIKERNQPFIEPGENYIIVEKLTISQEKLIQPYLIDYKLNIQNTLKN